MFNINVYSVAAVLLEVLQPGGEMSMTTVLGKQV